jgi:hypothetical protein
LAGRADKESVLTSALIIVLTLGAVLALLYLLVPRGTKVDEDTIRFSAEERVVLLVIAGGLIALGTFLRRVVGLDEDTDVGKIVLAIVGLPVIFLTFGAVFGRTSSD